MTDTGSNPFAEPDFSSIRPSGEVDSANDNDDEDLAEDEKEELGDDEFEEEDLDAAEEVGADDDEGDEEDPRAAPAATEPNADFDDAGNRVDGGTARSVLEHVARSIVDDPEGVSVEVAESRSGVRLSLHVAQGDMGRIIGRRGRTAQALRTLVRAAAARDGQEASVDIVD